MNRLFKREVRLYDKYGRPLAKRFGYAYLHDSHLAKECKDSVSETFKDVFNRDIVARSKVCKVIVELTYCEEFPAGASFPLVPF